MKTQLILFFVMICSTSVFSQLSPIVYKIEGVKKGAVVHYVLYNSENGFYNDYSKAILRGKAESTVDGLPAIVTKPLPSGNYAIALFADENGNEKMDKNMMGIPKEGFAFGNNAMGKLGPPTFEQAAIEHLGNKSSTQKIKLIYY